MGNNFLSKIDQNFKLQLIVCVTLSIIASTGLYIANKMLDGRKSQEYIIVEDIKFINSIESIIQMDNDLTLLNGYAFLLERDSRESSISIFLRNVDTQDEIWLETDQISRYDVDSFFDCEYDYVNSGFIAYIEPEELNKDACYEIIVNIDYVARDGKIFDKKARKTVSSGRYILNNEIYAYNPNEFDIPNINIKSELLHRVFNYGQLCFYQKDLGIYLYKYQDKLYWIATKDFHFKENETYIYYYLYTTQINKLPENRKKHKFDNKDFIFEYYEFIDESTEPYRVAIRDIPSDYPITYIRTGVYDKENQNNVWTKNFQLNHIFNVSVK